MCWKKSNIWNGSFITKVLKSKRLAHAYIFLGQDQQKKYWTALSLAKSLLCRNTDNDYCDVCSSCRQIDKGIHTDVFVLRPIGASRTIKIDMVRGLQSFLYLKSSDGGKKIGIVMDADRMRADAANAMLKTIEEPPDNSLLILISDDIEKILPTIVSRCQQIYFPVSPREIVLDFLVNECDVDKNKAEVIAGISQGSFTNAMRYIDDDKRLWRDDVIDTVFDFLDDRGDFMAIAQAFDSKISELAKKAVNDDPRYASSDPSSAGEELDDMEKKSVEKSLLNEEICDFFRFVESCCRDIIVYKETGNENNLINPDKSEKIKQMVRKFDFETINDILFSIQKAYEGFKGNTNLQFVLEILFENIQRKVAAVSK